MLSPASRKIIEDFALGRTGLKEFSDALDELLYEMLQTSLMTQEKKALSGMQLLIHELGEGLSTREEIDSYAKGLLASERAATAGPTKS